MFEFDLFWKVALPVAGLFLGVVVDRFFQHKGVEKALGEAREARLRALERMTEALPTPSARASRAQTHFTVERMVIENFKNIERLELGFCAKSSLAGNWICIAGINGAGKSAILQALCIVLLGERYATELGSARLRRMVRRTEDGPLPGARIEAWVRRGDKPATRLLLALDAEGVDEVALRSDPDYPQMRRLWEEMRTMVLVSYGAARNLSQEEDTRHDSAAKQVRRQMTLFDPLTRIADVDMLLKAGPDNEKKRRTLQRLLEAVLDADELRVHSESDRLVFGRTGTKVDAIDLPDGFRSTVAWLADLCGAWHDAAPDGQERVTDPSAIAGIVLLDEIDLHLHPSMARSIVPRLRKALPRVQFIVTTHSPLVLSSFDRNELIVLEADPKGVVGMRTLDRQVFAFTMDEVYKWLMRTPPQSTVIEEKIASGDDPNVASYLYQSGPSAPGEQGVNEEDSKLLVNDLERLLKEVKQDRDRR